MNSFQEKSKELRRDYEDRVTLLSMSFHISDDVKYGRLNRLYEQHLTDVERLRESFGVRRLNTSKGGSDKPGEI